MGDWTWVLRNADGEEMRATEPFDSKDEAEAFMGSDWQALLDEGAETVSLMEGDVQHYRMSLRPE